MSRSKLVTEEHIIWTAGITIGIQLFYGKEGEERAIIIMDDDK